MSLEIALQDGAVLLKNGQPGCDCCNEAECPPCDSAGVLEGGETCVYSFDLQEPSGCYAPNQPGKRSSQSFTIGPIEGSYTARIVSIMVDDDLEVDGVVVEAGQHLVELGEGETCEGTIFPGGQSASNGAHSLSNVSLGTYGAEFGRRFLTLRAIDNHGIDLYARGTIELAPLSPAP